MRPGLAYNREMRVWVLLAACLLGCDDDGTRGPGQDLAVADQGAPDLTPPIPVPSTTVPFDEIGGDILNPERGWVGYTGIGGSFSGIRVPPDPVATPPTTVTIVKMDLDQTQAQIPQGTLDALVSTLAAARAAGVKVILRPVYRMDDSGASGADPTSAPFVVSHVRQLGQTLRDQSDVIAVLQMGMLGPWGEFHTSPLIDNGGWVDILDALLEELPVSRMVQVRRPCHKDHYFKGRGPLLEVEAFNGSDVARVGHFNDCFLGDTLADQGTYENPTGIVPVRTIAEWRTYGAADTRYTFVGGETCGNNARASCDAARTDLAQFHWSYLGHGWYQPTVGPTGVLAACRGEITERLGYRLVLEEAVHSTSVRPGQSLALAVRLRNEGYAPPINPRPVFAVLSDGATTYRAELTGVDPRRWAPGQASTFSVTLGVPAGATAGMWSLSLWLPDAAMSIRDRSEYALRFANDKTWSASTGRNTLSTVAISPGAVENTTTPDATLQ
jgi:hypothetical protein